MSGSEGAGAVGKLERDPPMSDLQLLALAAADPTAIGLLRSVLSHPPKRVTQPIDLTDDEVPIVKSRRVATPRTRTNPISRTTTTAFVNLTLFSDEPVDLYDRSTVLPSSREGKGPRGAIFVTPPLASVTKHIPTRPLNVNPEDDEHENLPHRATAVDHH